MATSVTIGVDEIPVYVPGDTTNQTASRLRVVNRALSGGHGAGVLNQADFKPSISSNEVLVTKGTALVPTQGFDGGTSASAPEAGYFVVTMDSNITGASNLAPASDGTWYLVLRVDETSTEQAIIEIVSTLPASDSYLLLATLDTSGGTTTITSDDRFTSLDRDPRVYNSFLGVKGTSAYGSATANTDETTYLAAVHDPGGIAGATITPLVSGLYQVSLSFFTTSLLAGQYTWAFLNKNSTNGDTNQLGRAVATWGGSGTSTKHAGSFSQLMSLLNTDVLRVFTGSTAATTLTNISLGLQYVGPLNDGTKLPTGQVMG